MFKWIGEYFDVKVGDSDNIGIPKIPFHKEKMMPDHSICRKLATKNVSNKEEIKISPDNIPNIKLFENLLKFSFTKSIELIFSRCEYKDLEKICTYFNLRRFMEFVKAELRRIVLSSLKVFSTTSPHYSSVRELWSPLDSNRSLSALCN